MNFLIYFTCAFWATLLHQWTRRRLGFTRPRDCLRKRARSFVSHDVQKFRVSLVVHALLEPPHLSLRIIVIGLLVWLSNFSRTVFCLVGSWSVLHVVTSRANERAPLTNVLVTWLTFRKFRLQCLSPRNWFPYTHAILEFLSSAFGASPRSDSLKIHHNNRPLDGIEKTAENIAWQQPSKLDVHILGQKLDALGKDDAWEESFKTITSLFDSEQVRGIEEHILDEFRIKFKGALNLVPEPVRSSQLITYLNATYAVLGTDEVSQILQEIFYGRWPELLQSVEMAHSLRRWGDNTDKQFTDCVRRIVTHVVAGVQERDNRWISLAKAEFGVQDHVLRDNIEYGDSALLSLLIHVTRQAFHCGSWTPFILEPLAQIEIRNTRPELQHEFCSLWNEIVREAWRVGTDSAALNILREIRQAFIGLHQGTDAAPTPFSAHTNHYNPVLTQALSYRFCNLASHRPNGTRRDPAVNQFTIHSPTRAGLDSSPASTTQLGISPSHSPRPPPSKIQRVPGNAGALIVPSEANVVHAATQQAEEVSIKGYDV